VEDVKVILEFAWRLVEILLALEHTATAICATFAEPTDKRNSAKDILLF